MPTWTGHILPNSPFFSYIRMRLYSCLALMGIAMGCSGKEPPGPSIDQLQHVLALPQMRLALQAKVDSTWKKRDLNYQITSFQGRYRQRITALVCYSDLAASRPLPALIFMPGSSKKKENLLIPQDLVGYFADAGYLVMSLDRQYRDPQALAAALAAKGLVKVWGEFVYDLQRGLDYLDQRPEVDPARIAVVGVSLGGWEALLLAAMDQRIKGVACIGGQIVWRDIFAQQRWQEIFPGLPLTSRLKAAGIGGEEAYRAFKEQNPGLEHIEAPSLAPMIAPRPLMLMVGSRDPLIGAESVKALYQRILPLYNGNEARLGMEIAADTGHRFTRGMRDTIRAWLNRWI
jgi:hypothetical protein